MLLCRHVRDQRRESPSSDKLTARPYARPTACNCTNGVCPGPGSQSTMCSCSAGWTTAANGTQCAACEQGYYMTGNGDCLGKRRTLTAGGRVATNDKLAFFQHATRHVPHVLAQTAHVSIADHRFLRHRPRARSVNSRQSRLAMRRSPARSRLAERASTLTRPQRHAWLVTVSVRIALGQAKATV